MNFDLQEDHNILRHTVREFALKEIYPFVREWERKEYFPRELIVKMGQELGFFGAAFPAKYGGTELGFLANAIVAEELARVSLGIASSCNMQSGTCPMTILNWGTEEQKKNELSKIITCEALGCFGLTEPNAATDVAAINTTAIDKGDHYLVNGSKTWITHATQFDIGILFAKTDPKLRHEGLSAFLIKGQMPNLTSRKIHDKLGTRCSDTGELFFEDCVVPKENILGKPGQGFIIAESSLAYGRTSIAARSVGIAQACLDASLKYADTREQFGVKIGKFQMNKQLIADMVADIEAARLLVYRSAWLVDENRVDPLQSTIAKFFASESALRAAINAMKIHGAYGYSDEYDVARYYRDVMLMTTGEGTSNIQRIIIANDALGWKKAKKLYGN